MRVAVGSSQGSGYRSSRGQGKHRMNRGLEALWGSMVLWAYIADVVRLCKLGIVVGL